MRFISFSFPRQTLGFDLKVLTSWHWQQLMLLKWIN
jgi:hypothetical protein